MPPGTRTARLAVCQRTAVRRRWLPCVDACLCGGNRRCGRNALGLGDRGGFGDGCRFGDGRQDTFRRCLDVGLESAGSRICQIQEVCRHAWQGSRSESRWRRRRAGQLTAVTVVTWFSVTVATWVWICVSTWRKSLSPTYLTPRKGSVAGIVRSLTAVEMFSTTSVVVATSVAVSSCVAVTFRVAVNSTVCSCVSVCPSTMHVRILTLSQRR